MESRDISLQLAALRNALDKDAGNATIANKYYVKGSATSGYAAFLAKYNTTYSDGTVGVYNTLTAALAAVGAGSIIYLAPGQYDETPVVSTANITIIGMGGRGAAYIEPDTAAAEGMKVTADDVTIINLGLGGESTSDYALNLNSCSRFRAYGCKIEGPSILALINGTAGDQTADALFEDCEFAWGDKAVVFDDSAYGYPTQIFFKNCRFHNIVTHMFGVNTGGLVYDLHVEGCFFGNQEDGTAPTDYILLSDNGNKGCFFRNYFATATNATGVLTIGTGIKWVSNHTEAGESTARPA